MTDTSSQRTLITLKRVVQALAVILLLNPVTLYLVTGRLWVSLFVPSFSLVLVFLLATKDRLKHLNILLFNLLLIVSFFLHAEAIFTYRFSDYIIEDLYVIKNKYYFNRPYLNQTFRDKEYIVQYKTNKQGFRIGVEDEPDAEVHQADWLFIGDSYTQGAQVQYEELYTTQLFDSFPNKIIVNAGISGFGIADEYHYYINEGKNLKANKVFLQICNFNDFMKVNESTSGFSDYLMHHSNFARFALYDFKYANPAELPLGRWTEPFYSDEKSNELYNIFYKVESDQKRQDLRNFEKFLIQFNEKVKENGGELIVLQIPTKEQVHYKYFEEVVRTFKLDVTKLDMHYPNQFLDQLCKKNNIQRIDLLKDFMEKEYELFYQFDEHLNRQGHQQLAASITEFMREREEWSMQPIRLSALNVGDRYPNAARSDCNLMVYQSFRDGNMELFISDSLLQNEQRLTWNKIDELHPSASPDGTQLAFTEGDQASHMTRVALMNMDASERRYITDGQSEFGAIPTFDPTGTKITYAEWKSDKARKKLSNPYIVVIDLLNGQKSKITSDSFEYWRPIFNNKGEKIFFISKESGNQFDVFEFDLKTGVKRNLTSSPYEEWDPAISNDGKKLVFAANKYKNWDLFQLDLETGQTSQLTKSLGDEWDPSFSPCGQFLYFAGTFGLHNGIFKLPLN